MASGASKGSSRGSAWTQRQNKQFECALAVYDRETPDRWHNIARYMGGSKSAEEVRRHFEQLVEDVAQIEAGRVPFPCYSSISAVPPHGAARGLDEARSKYLKFQ
ncbi:protein RADIALIS-like 3 [Phragmites australis]|uniref:protein RADIALIS-like 3 n=1 Tax=Phragmites australis TaxID=29695 RepID=UPI002D76CFFF|nr:protein RADIALIS-like 3 [Phragmites australis]